MFAVAAFVSIIMEQLITHASTTTTIRTMKRQNEQNSLEWIYAIY